MAELDGTAGNSTIVWSTAESIPLGAYCFFATVMGLCGNSLVLYSSIRYDALQLDDVSLTFVRNLAVADILYTLASLLPISITYMTREYLLGDQVCFIDAQVSSTPVISNVLTVLAITSHRLCLLRPPYHSISKTTANIMVALIWLVSTSPTIAALSYHSNSVFDPVTAACSTSVYDDAPPGVIILIFGVLCVLPLLAITLLSVILSVIAIKHSKLHSNDREQQRNNKALILVCSVAGLMLVSWIPYIVRTVMGWMNHALPPSVTVLGSYGDFINTFGNPFLYSFTNVKFRDYIKNVLNGIFRKTSVAAGIKTTKTSNIVIFYFPEIRTETNVGFSRSGYGTRV